MDVTPRIFFLRMVNEVVHIALERAIAASGVGIEPTARFDGDVRRFLHRHDGEIPCRLHHDTTLAADPRNNGRPIFVVVAPARFALLAATTRSAAQMSFPALFRLPLLARSVIEFIRFHGALQLPLHLVGQGGIAQPPTPAVAGTDMHPQLSGNAARGTGQAQEKRCKNPVHDRALAAIQERSREVIEGALAVLLFTAVALQSGLVVVGAPRTDVVALTSRTLEGPIFPPQRMDVGVAGLSIEELVEV